MMMKVQLSLPKNNRHFLWRRMQEFRRLQLEWKTAGPSGHRSEPAEA
jgi:hypothetical protein